MDWGMGNTFANGLLPLSPLFLLLAIWSLAWKGLALWHTAQRGKTVWFVVFLFLNTLGILEIIYLFFIAKIKPENVFSNNSSSNHVS